MTGMWFEDPHYGECVKIPEDDLSQVICGVAMEFGLAIRIKQIQGHYVAVVMSFMSKRLRGLGDTPEAALIDMATKAGFLHHCEQAILDDATQAAGSSSKPRRI